MVGQSGVEPPTLRLSGVRSNQLSYWPSFSIISVNSDRGKIEGIAERVQRLLRKEVIQPHLPVRLPCYDFAPVIGLTFGGSYPALNSPHEKNQLLSPDLSHASS
jgi:hypothetical protein